MASTELLARDAEIAALKETIRLECEERNELMERLERMSVAGVAADMAGLVASKKEKSPSSRVTSSVATASLAEKSPEEVAFETLMEKRRRSSHKHPVQKRV